MAMLLSAGIAWAQPIEPPQSPGRLHVARFEPMRIDVAKGEDAFVLIHGEGLEQLTEARMLRDGVEAESIEVTLADNKGRDTAVRILRISVGANAEPERYRVQLLAGRGVVATTATFDLTVIDASLVPHVESVKIADSAVRGVPLRVRVHAAAPRGLASVRVQSGEVWTQGQPDPRDPQIVDLGITFEESGPHELWVVAEDRDGRTGPPWSTTIEVLDPVADLLVDEITLKPEHPYAGQSVGAFVTVANRGSVKATLPARTRLLEWRFDDTEERSFALAEEVVIESDHVRIFGPLVFRVDQGGSRPVHVVIDPDQAVLESDEDNNTFTRIIDVAPGQYPDLTISRVEFDPAPPSVNGPFVARTRVTNQGSATATIFPPNLVLVATGFADVQAGPQAVVIAPGDSLDFVMQPVEPLTEPGLRRWTFTVDPGSHVAESAEGNNTYIASAIVSANRGASADLVLDHVEVRPAEPKANEPMFLILGIRNAGDREVLIPAGFQFYELTGPMGRVIPILTQTAERLAPGKARGMRTVDFAIATPGAHQVTIRLDPNGLVAEGDEANNITTRTIVVKE
jgi:hypothetical protein